MAELRVRDVTESDLPAVAALRVRSFGPLRDSEEVWWRQIARANLGGRMLSVVDDADTMLAAGRIHAYEQVWGGRHLRMGGVAGVYVEPSARGRGVASFLMRGLLARMAELGDVVSCLYPTTTGLYRKVGYEVVGVQPRHTYAAHTLRALRAAGAGRAVRPAIPSDAERIHMLMREAQGVHRLAGPTVPSVETWRRRLEAGASMTYVAEDGFVDYGLSNEMVLTVEHLVATSPETAAALWAVVASGSTFAPTIRAHLDPRDPVRLVTDGLPELEVTERPWMLRVVDLEAAIAERRFGEHVRASGRLTVADADCPANEGLWQLEVSDGQGSATRAGSTAYGSAEVAHLGSRALAALWGGWSMSRLRQAGLATGGSPEQDAALDAIFACTPFMTEHF